MHDLRPRQWQPAGHVRPAEIARLIRVGRPPAPHGARRLARSYSIDDIAKVARRRLPAGAAAYLEGGGEDEYTLRRNRAAFDDYEILPGVLEDVSEVETSTTLLGSDVPVPIALAPVGAPRMFHHQGEVAAARAAGAAGLPYGISTLATVPLEDIARAAAAPLWLQLYVWGDRSVAQDLVAQAAQLGFRALILSVDVTVRSKRERELHAGIKLPTPQLTPGTLLDGALHPSWSWHFLTSPALDFPNIADGSSGRAEVADMFDGTVTWGDVDWIRDAWDGPLAVKGVLDPEDARRAIDHGADAVLVSNHGGRQLDHLPATIDVLADVVDAVGDSAEVLLDSGVRRGTDILSALALGARGVLVGRAYLYGLAAAGEAGVRHAIDILTGELKGAMALSGAGALSDIHRGMIRRRRR